MRPSPSCVLANFSSYCCVLLLLDCVPRGSHLCDLVGRWLALAVMHPHIRFGDGSLLEFHARECGAQVAQELVRRFSLPAREAALRGEARQVRVDAPNRSDAAFVQCEIRSAEQIAQPFEWIEIYRDGHALACFVAA